MTGEIFQYTGIVSEVFYQVYTSDKGPLLNKGTFVVVKAHVLGGQVVHISLHNPDTGTMVCQQIVATREQLLRWVLPLDTSLARVLYA